MKYSIFLLFPLIVASCSGGQEYDSPNSQSQVALQKKQVSTDISFAVKTHFDSNVTLDCVILHDGIHDFHDTKDPINQQVKESILDSLKQYSMYDMWALKRSTIEKTLERIVKRNHSKVEWLEMRDVVIPEEAKEQFFQRENAKQAILAELDEVYQEKKTLKEKLETDSSLSDLETLEISREIELLDKKSTSIREKGKLLTLDFEL